VATPKPHGTLCGRGQDYEICEDIFYQHVGQVTYCDARERDPQYHNQAENEDGHPRAKLNHQLRSPTLIQQPIHGVSPCRDRLRDAGILDAMSSSCDERHAFRLVRWHLGDGGLPRGWAFLGIGTARFATWTQTGIGNSVDIFCFRRNIGSDFFALNLSGNKKCNQNNRAECAACHEDEKSSI
jgi:hypothetical protein